MSQTLKGFVRNPDGQPLEKVRVHPEGSILAEYTDNNGFFKLEWKGLDKERLIIFELNEKEDYAFKILKIENFDEDVNVMLEPKKIPYQEIPICKFVGLKKIKLLGRNYVLSVPKNFKTKSGTYDHGLFYRAFFPKGKTTESLSGYETFGALKDDYPPATYIFNSDIYNFKRIEGGFDWQGVTREGKYWRFFQTFFENYSYFTESKETAEFFDGMLDNDCLRTSQK